MDIFKKIEIPIIATEKLQNVFISLLIIVAAITAGFIIHAILIKILSKWKKRREAGARGLKINIGYLKAPLRALVPALCLVFVSPVLQFSDPVTDFESDFKYLDYTNNGLAGYPDDCTPQRKAAEPLSNRCEG
ncbi:hypothetical protein GF407_03460 [candidate division KSB1 bacterium]|nr:hypothetical protein [candidate division KSB1 bacterium]